MGARPSLPSRPEHSLLPPDRRVRPGGLLRVVVVVSGREEGGAVAAAPGARRGHATGVVEVGQV